MTDEIINALAKIEQLKVTSRTSSFFFKDHKAPIREIGKKLNVSTILEGSIRASGDLLRITAQLIDVEKDVHLWSETWDRKKDNVFEVQDEISLLIADKLRENYGHLEFSDHLSDSHTRNLNAYEHYLKGKSLFNKWNPEDVNEAISHFEKAIAIDDLLIDAHTGLADAYSFMAVAGFAPREEALKKSMESIRKAQKIDPKDAPLNYLLANHHFFSEADFATAMKYGQRSIASKPTYSEAQQYMCFLYILKGEMKKAKEHLMYAKSIDPLNQETLFFEAFYLYRLGEYESAAEVLRQLLASNDRNLPALITLSYVLLVLNKPEEVLLLIDTVPREMIMPDEYLSLQCYAYFLMGEKKKANEILTELIRNSQENTSLQADSYLYIIYAYLEKYEEALLILDKLFDRKSSILLLMFGDPLAEKVFSHPKYKEYHDRIYPDAEQDTLSVKSSNASLEPAIVSEYAEKLEEFIKQDNPYLNPSLTLRSLAEMLQIHPNHLSWLLNNHIGKNFNEYVNELRVGHFKKLVINPSNSHISIIGLAYESGFSSKTVFNTVFKKVTGMTPREYQRQYSHQE